MKLLDRLQKNNSCRLGPGKRQEIVELQRAKLPEEIIMQKVKLVMMRRLKQDHNKVEINMEGRCAVSASATVLKGSRASKT